MLYIKKKKKKTTRAWAWSKATVGNDNVGLFRMQDTCRTGIMVVCTSWMKSFQQFAMQTDFLLTFHQQQITILSDSEVKQGKKNPENNRQ